MSFHSLLAPIPGGALSQPSGASSAYVQPFLVGKTERLSVAFSRLKCAKLRFATSRMKTSAARSKDWPQTSVHRRALSSSRDGH